MPFSLTFEVDGAQQMSRSFSRLAEDIQDATEPFTEMAADFNFIEAQQFNSEGGYGSGGWAPLSPSYALWKAALFPGRPILQRTGLMAASLMAVTPWSIREIQPLVMILGTRVGHAIFHQRGTARMPARPVIQLTEADKLRWSKIFHQWLIRRMRRQFAGLGPQVGEAQRAMRGMGL